MYQVIVADDEPTVREGIQKYIQRIDSEIRVVGLFKNGLQVREFLENNMVDIIISDINMPVMTGLELAEYIYIHNLPTELIIVSGYKEFEYAKKAIEYQVKNYILKPIDLGELSAALSSAKQNVTQTKALAEDKKNHVELLDEIRRQDFAFLCQGIMSAEALMTRCKSTKDREHDLGDIQNNFCGVANLQICGFDNIVKYQWEFEKETFYLQMQSIGERRTPEFMSYQIMKEGQNVTFFLLTNTQNSNDAEELMQDYLLNLQEDFSSQLNIQVETSLVKYDNIFCINHQIMDGNFEEKAKAYLSFLLQGDTAAQELLIQTLLQETTGPSYLKSFLKALFTASEKMLKTDLSAELKQITHISSIEEAKQSLSSIRQKLHTSAPSDKYLLVSKIQLYIDENFKNDISLEDVADAVYMNSAYLSRVFKNVTGEKFIDYLIRIRMKNAITLLETKKHPVSKVAELVGYKQVKYFSKSFKQYTGYSPREYIMIHIDLNAQKAEGQSG